MSNSKAILEINDLVVRFHIPEGTVYAVNNISYNVGEKETLAIVGESGCGKSVSVMSILGLIPQPPGEIVSGSAQFYGKDLFKMSEKEMLSVRGKEIGLIFQDPMTSLNPVLSIEQQLTEAITRHYDVSKSEARKQALEYLDFVGIPDSKQRIKEYPHQFSGGMRQRAMIAMMMALKPKLLVADEPTTALDVTIQAQIIDLTKKLKRETGMSMIWITHDLGVVAELANRVIVMYAGQIMEKADVITLFGQPRHPYTLALLKSVPRMDARRQAERLDTIQGAPPNLHHMPEGCPFVDRCQFALEKCWNQNPPLEEVGPGQFAACWVDVRTGKPHS
jgi:oligopeptide transport system ATP-binding protein